MNRFRVLTVLFLLGFSTGFCETTNTSGRIPSSPAPDLAQCRLEAVHFEGGRSFSVKQLSDAFNVPVGDKFNDAAIVQGLDRLRQLYGDYGYINFAAVPTFQVEQDRRTVVLTVSIDEGSQFTFGRLILAGQEPRTGEADAMRKAWTALSGKRYDSSLLCEWLIQNAAFLPNPPCRHVELHQDSSTHQADIKLTFP